jgi:hypothetical protein
LAWFGGLPIDVALRAAALARGPNGKLSHQRRLTYASLREGRRCLTQRLTAPPQFASFAELLIATESVAGSIHGLGRLWAYDTALRIASHWAQLPDRVHLHAGASEGAQALRFPRHTRSVELNELPPELRRLPAYAIENFLCIYRGELAAAARLSGWTGP